MSDSVPWNWSIYKKIGHGIVTYQTQSYGRINQLTYTLYWITYVDRHNPCDRLSLTYPTRHNFASQTDRINEDVKCRWDGLPQLGQYGVERLGFETDV